MNPQQSDPHPNRGSLIGWLARLNSDVSQWASSASWWRLIVLFLVILIAGSIIGDLLQLKHDRVQVSGHGKEVVVSIGGKDGIRVFRNKAGRDSTPSRPADAASGAEAGSPRGAISDDPDEDDDEDRKFVSRKIITFRGI